MATTTKTPTPAQLREMIDARNFAKLARKWGDEETAKVWEDKLNALLIKHYGK